MDRNRWLIVLTVFCMMIITLTLLRKHYGTPLETPDQVIADSGTANVSDVSGPDEPPAGARTSNHRRQPAAPVDLSPPPRFFLAVATPEEDGKEMQELAERGKAVKPDAYTASGTGNAGRPGRTEGGK